MIKPSTMDFKRDVAKYGLKKARKMRGIVYKSPYAGRVIKDSKGRLYEIQPDGSHRRVRG